MEKTETGFKSGVTPRSLIIGIVLTLFTIFYFGTWGEWMAIGIWHPIRGVALKDLWPINMVTDFGSGTVGPNSRWTDSAFGVILFLTFLPVLMTALVPAKYRLSINELAFISSMAVPAVMISTMYLGVGNIPASIPWGLKDPTQNPLITKYIASFLILPTAVTSPMDTGKALVPWDSWAIPIAYWIGLFLSTYVFQLFIATIFRRMYIEIEDLPFPLARVTYETLNLVKAGGSESKPQPSRAKWILIGTLISAIITFGASMCNWYPKTPGIPLSYDLTPIVLNSIPIFYYAPPLFGLGLLLSIEVLLTQVGSYVILYLILPPILIGMGQLAIFGAGTNAHNAHSILVEHFQNSPSSFFYGGYDFLAMGVFLAIGIWPIIVHRGYVVESIRSTLKSGKPLLDRIQWIGLILSGAALLAFYVAAGPPIQYAIPMIVYAGVAWLCIGRIQAECGGGLGAIQGADAAYGVAWEFPILFGMGMGIGGVPQTAYPIITMSSFIHGSNDMLESTQTGWSLDSYKVGKLTETEESGFFISNFLGILLAVVITIPVAVWLFYTYGSTGRATGYIAQPFTFAYDLAVLNRMVHITQPATGAYVLLIFGFLLVVVISILRAKLGGIFTLIAPVGIWLAVQWGTRYWFPFLIVLIVKPIVRKIGGTVLYDRTMIPLAVGLILGWALIHPFAALSQILIGLGYKWW